MSLIHLKVESLGRWRSVCTACPNSKPKKIGSQSCKLKYTVHYGLGHMCSYCHCSGVPGLEWYIHHELQIVKVGFRQIQECHSGLDCRSQLCLTIKYRPGNTWQRKLQLGHESPSRVPVSNSLGCWSEVWPNYYDMPVQPTALPQISEPESHILTQGLHISETVFIAAWDWQLFGDSRDDMCPGLSSAPDLASYGSKSINFGTNMRAVSHILTQQLNIT